jgi:hypothetical protein
MRQFLCFFDMLAFEWRIGLSFWVLRQSELNASVDVGTFKIRHGHQAGLL